MRAGIEQLKEVHLSHDEAMALAQLVKRLSWAEIRTCAVDDTEAWVIKAAIGRLQSALAYHGYSPR
ncbi:hypothetical protein CE143_01610 [Photorhabdus luminescens]|uniref:Uncharacterized protein n=2 Tax=Photorhabdus TaxID=29487 RepID=A0A329WQD1_9GAMM|nr:MULTISPECIES: hypothetical protein [Photorhabdus]UJD73801.1 hypothetical protein CE143_01570 [Photorhabdus luminescens]QXF32008.1 hypothetical protein B0X70_01580 [Photorhabdus akhurstii]QXF32014.1 hypothetical protein B0X70_01625 [Photorhabdus akhurstii]RAX06739.1 hypothetical protein CKY02_22255 [Photorhabdus bodei]UJD73808.1 hypothetical protein CE143_01610 [Photorhabdus luminescens]